MTRNPNLLSSNQSVPLGIKDGARLLGQLGVAANVVGENYRKVPPDSLVIELEFLYSSVPRLTFSLYFVEVVI